MSGERPVQSHDEPLGAIIGQGRPVVPVGDFSQAGIWGDTLNTHRDAIERAARATGRILLPDQPGLMFSGTGFLVGPDLLLTTRQVAEVFTSGVGSIRVGLRSGWSVAVDFTTDTSGQPAHRCRIIGVAVIHPVLDVALLRVELAEPVLSLSLSSRPGEDLVEHKIIAVGYVTNQPPAGAENFEQAQALHASIFHGLRSGKHLFPGQITGSRMVNSFGQPVWALTHDCSTLFHNAGAPIVELQSGLVVGIHSGGTFLVEQLAVPTSELLHDQRVVDALGVTAQDLRPSARVWQLQWEQADAASEAPPASSVATSVPPGPATGDRNVRDSLIGLINSALGGAERFAELLTAAGHKNVVTAVPREPDESYARRLVQALDRRGLLDDRLLERIHKLAGVPLQTGDEPAAEMLRQTEPAEEPVPPARPAAVEERPAPDAGPVSGADSAVEELVAAIRDTEADSRDAMDILAIGSQWRDLLLGPDGRTTTVAETIARLAGDDRPDSKQALTWLAGRLTRSLSLQDPARRERLAKAYKLLIPEQQDSRSQPVMAVSNSEIADVDYLSRGVDAARAVVLMKVERGDSKGQFGGSTGWLLAPSLVVVAAHLITGASGEFDQPALDDWARRATASFDFDSPQSQPTQIGVRRVELVDTRLDLAIVRLKRRVTDRKPLQVTAEPPEPGRGALTLIHHPRMGPKKISIHGGRLIETDSHQAIYIMASEAGSAGGPVMDMDWRVIATHRARQDYRSSPEAEPIPAKTGTTTSALLRALRNAGGVTGQLWREVAEVQPALRVIDNTLFVQLAQTRRSGEPQIVPMVIQLSRRSKALQKIAGLKLGTVSDFVVTATGDRQAIDALAKLPEVISVTASRPGGSMECARSIPHIGALKVHQEMDELGDRAIVAVIDNGADIFHHALRDANGKTRLLAFWDQKDERARAGDPATLMAAAMSDAGRAFVQEAGLGYGALYLAEDIQRLLDKVEPLPASYPDAAEMTHGTAVCSIAAGRRTGDAEDQFSGGVAPAASLVVVRFDLQGRSVGYSKGHIDALAFIDRLADKLAMPVVVNISNGMNTGAHDGTSDLEERCEHFCHNGRRPGRIIVKSAGNERGKGRHASVQVAQGKVEELRWRSSASPNAAPGTASIGEMIELWFDHMDKFRFRLRPPSGDWSPPISVEFKTFDEFLENGNRLAAVLRPYHPENGDGFLRLQIGPGKLASVESGDWTLEITGAQVKTTEPIHAWVEESLARELKFLDYMEDKFTVTVPGTAEHVITVGAIATADEMRSYRESSAGPGRNGRRKPDLVAPGVELRPALAASGDGIFPVSNPPSGTSLAAPHVTGAIALALSARANQPGAEQLNANQVHGALLDTVRHLNANWNERTGFGALNVADFFAQIQRS